MQSRFQLRAFALLTTLLLASTVASAGTFVFDLPVPQQSLDTLYSAIEVPFAAGMQFRSVASITIELSGTTEKGVTRTLIRLPDKPIEVIPIGGPIEIWGYPSFETRYGEVDPLLAIGLLRTGRELDIHAAGLGSNAGPKTWESAFGATSRFPVPDDTPGTAWNGEAIISFYLDNAFITNWSSMTEVLTSPVIHLRSARVTIVGQAVPEPSSVVLGSLVFLAGWFVRSRELS